MKSTFVAGAVLVSAALPLHAAEYRLAFSQANALEVFIEHPDGAEWCSPALEMRFQGEGAANPKLLEQMMPKLGSLLDRECAQAEFVNWKSVGADNRLLAQGHSSQGASWALLPAQAVAEAPAPVPAAETPATPPASPPAAPVAQAESPAASPAAPSTPAAPQPAEPQSSGQQVQQQAAAPESPTVETAQAPAAEPAVPAPAAKATSQSLEPISSNFAVAGWRPRSTADTLTATAFSMPLKDQQGCQYNTHYKLDAAPEYVRVSSTDIACDAHRRAQGNGTLNITRSDGKSLGQVRANWVDGLPFSNGSPAFSVQHIGEQALFGYLGSDDSRQIHYLLEVRADKRGTWNLQNPRVIALSGQPELFRNAEQIQAITAQAQENALKVMDSNSTRLRFLAVSDVTEIFAGDRYKKDSYLYEVGMRKGWDKKWITDTQGATNHFFVRDARQAKEQELAARQAKQAREWQMREDAVAQQRHLDLYESLATKTFEQRLQQWLNEPKFEAGGGDYLKMMRGQPVAYRQIIEISKQDKTGEWLIEKPYQGYLVSNTELKKGWYMASGEVRLDTARRDKQDLPVTVLKASQLLPCEDKDCKDLFEPARMVASMTSQPDWSPEAAMQLVKNVKEGNFE